MLIFFLTLGSDFSYTFPHLSTTYPKLAPKIIKPTVPDNTIRKPNYISMRL